MTSGLKYRFYCWGCQAKLPASEVEVCWEGFRCLRCGSYAVDPLELVPGYVLEAPRPEAGAAAPTPGEAVQKKLEEVFQVGEG